MSRRSRGRNRTLAAEIGRRLGQPMSALEAVALLRRAHEELSAQARLRAEREARGRPTVAVYVGEGGAVEGVAVGPGDRLEARLILVDFRAGLDPAAGEGAVAFEMADGTTKLALISEIRPTRGAFDPGEVLAARAAAAELEGAP